MDITTINAAITAAALLMPIATGCTAVIRTALSSPTKPFPDRFVPLLSVIVAVTLSMLFFEPTMFGALAGFVCGLAGTGLYEFGKKTVLGITPVADPTATNAPRNLE
jgi:hypothetical protein